MSSQRSFRVMLFSNLSPRETARFAARIEREVPEAGVRGIIHQRSVRGSQNSQESSVDVSPEASLLRGLGTEDDSRHFNGLAWLGSLLLRFIHACPAEPKGAGRFESEDLARFCEDLGCPLALTNDLNSQEARKFVDSLEADLGIVCGALPDFDLYRAPRSGSIRPGISKVHVRSCDGTPDPSDVQPGGELQVDVRQVDRPGEPAFVLCSESFPIGPFDTLTSVRLKSGLVGNDLLIRAVTELARGTLPEEGKRGVVEPAPVGRPVGGERDLPPRYSSYRTQRGRPGWKLLLRTLLFGPYVIVRNWVRRARGSFPVIILFHHVVTDRPHHLGIPSELFLRQVEFLRKHYRIVSLSEAIEMLKAGKVEAPSVVLTFDDGYRENFVNLRAITDRFGVPATLFVCTNHLTKGTEFQHDLKKGQRGFWPFTWRQVEYLSRNGFAIGSHTRTHLDCGSQDLEALENEIVGSKVDLEQHLPGRVEFFSFPWGHPVNMSPPAVALAKITYAHSVSGFGGANFPSSGTDFSLLRRVSHPNDLWELELALQSVLDL
jgi:peptidoglycan/xylan/chitin deacetylase (PgdA/CDA1 family)